MRDTVNISRVSFIECPTVGCTQQLQPYFVKKTPKTDVHCIMSPEFQSMQGPQPDDQFLGWTRPIAYILWEQWRITPPALGSISVATPAKRTTYSLFISPTTHMIGPRVRMWWIIGLHVSHPHAASSGVTCVVVLLLPYFKARFASKKAFKTHKRIWLCFSMLEAVPRQSHQILIPSSVDIKSP